MTAVFLNHAALNCSLGNDLSQVEHRLFNAQQEQALTWTDNYSPGRKLPLGLVTSTLPDVPVDGEKSRNNRLLTSAMAPLLPELERLKERYSTARIGIVIGTSTSGVAEGEAALIPDGDDVRLAPDYRYTTQEFSAPSRFLSRWLNINGPCWTVSTACTSGGKALTAAARLIDLGVCDAVIAGGVDTLCRMTVAGFSSLLVTSETPSNPFSLNRSGINIGEGAALFIVSKDQGPVRLAGFGETSDAYHISSPEPEGKGAEAAMRTALASAGITPREVDYINLHGTATEQNDLMESRAVNRVFGDGIACSSTKPLTGHTLAAAGAIEALFCWLALQREDGLLPPHLWDGVIDPELAELHGLGVRQLAQPAKYALSNSFAFGGNNLALLMVRE